MSEKYKDQIEEILKRSDEVLGQEGSQAARSKPRTSGKITIPLGRLMGGRGLKLSAGKLMLTSFALLLLALVLGATKVGGVVYLVAAGLILFVIAYGLFFIRPGPSSSYEKRWRGRVIVDDRPSIWDRVRRWLKS